jgi:hypothetical protein
MADVFLSYAREDRDTAERLAHALGARNWSVWWDREIVVGESFDGAIERELAGAGAVVVLWSKTSVASEWVKNEAADANARGVLVPAALDRTPPPLEFRRRQVADLTGWSGQQSHPGFESLCKGILAKVDTPAGPPEVVLSRPRSPLAIVVAGLVLVVGLGAVLLARRTGDAPPAVSTPPATDVPAFAKRESSLAGRELADVLAGTYAGAVVSDAKGHSQSDVTVTITKVSARRVRISADYERVRTVEVDLTRVGDRVVSAAGPSTLLLDGDTLDYSPDGEVTYAGTRRP